MTAANPTAESAISALPTKLVAAPRRVLIILLGAIGDVVRALPLLGRIRQAWPAAHIAWAVEPKSQAVLEGHPWLDELIVYNRRCAAFVPALPCAGARGPFRSRARPPAPSQERGSFDCFRSPRAGRLRSLQRQGIQSSVFHPAHRAAAADAPEADAVPGLRRRARASAVADGVRPRCFGRRAGARARRCSRVRRGRCWRSSWARHGRAGFIFLTRSPR